MFPALPSGVKTKIKIISTASDPALTFILEISKYGMEPSSTKTQDI